MEKELISKTSGSFGGHSLTLKVYKTSKVTLECTNTLGHGEVKTTFTGTNVQILADLFRTASEWIFKRDERVMSEEDADKYFKLFCKMFLTAEVLIQEGDVK